MDKPNKCKGCIFAHFGYDYRDSNCRNLTEAIRAALKRKNPEMAKEMFGDVRPSWCPFES